ncbi:MAG TPA: hypothetical protein VNA21_13640 [Steroidobacteraceae bacterium]|nr:hypothetical protein [Steroidobacteraceae bacterium]
MLRQRLADVFIDALIITIIARPPTSMIAPAGFVRVAARVDCARRVAACCVRVTILSRVPDRSDIPFT